METRIPASERTSQKLNEQIKLAVRKIAEEALAAEVTDALGRGYHDNGPEPDHD